MMRLADEVRAEIQAFATGRVSERELEGWLDSVSADIHADGNAELRALTDRVLSLLAEASYGDRTVDEVRRELTALLSMPVHTAETVPPRTETGVARGTGE